MSLTDQFDEQHAELLTVKAAEAELTDGPDAALEVLGPPTDPIRMRTALGILLRANRYQVAADLIRDQRVDEKWVHLAVIAFASLGDIARARALVDQADAASDLSVMRSSRLGFAEGVIESWRKGRSGNSLLDPEPWPEADIELAKTVIDLLDPLLSSVRANRKIGGEYELAAVTYAVYCAWIARAWEFLSQYIDWLLKYVPIPLIVAEICLRGLTASTPEGLPNRLRVEHPNDFQAAFLAVIVERDLFDKSEIAFDALVDLAGRARSDEEKESVCIALFETCGLCGSEQIQKAIEIVTSLKPAGSRILGLLRAMNHLAHDNLSQAKDQLEAIREESDGVWWQAQAQICERIGDEEGAQHAWEKASELVPHPDVVRRSIKASIDRRRYQSAIRGLGKLLEQDPDNADHLKMLAWAQVQLGDHVQAAIHLSRLVELDPLNHDYRLWLAQSLARTARTAEAIGVLKLVCDAEDAPLEAILFQSELLAADGKPEDAFRLLEAIAPDHWDDSRFLLSYVKRGHGAGQDRLAHEAFARILEMRQEGKIGDELIQVGTLEQLLEYGKSFRSRREALLQALIAGRMTWLFAEDTLGNPPAWAWTLHTQELKWLSEEPLTRAAFSIYATNGFTVRGTPTGKSLQEITAPQAGTEVVADLTALLTLHKLGALERAAEYLGAIVLPASYGLFRVRDADRFGQHQPSREQELLTIRDRIDQRRICVEAEWPEGGIELDEYSDDVETHAYRLRDLIPLLRTTQKVTSGDIAELTKVAHKPSTADAAHPVLQLGDTVLVDLMTLRTLTHTAVFDQVLDALSICIRATDNEEVVSELRAHEAARAARNFHDALWHQVAELEKQGSIRWHPLPTPTEVPESPEKDVEDVIFFDSLRLAQHLEIPLLADDRVLQVLAFHNAEGGPLPAFGSDCVVHGMLESGAYDAGSAARDFRQLMNWRYRFILPSADILFAWAHESGDDLPGPALLDAAFYLHDSLRDPGLHCGPEQSEPPTPMAVKYLFGWMNSVVSFLAKVWIDGRFSDNACDFLTRWVGEELIPSCPRGLWYQEVGYNISRGERFSVFGMAILQFIGINDPGRANQALRALAESLGLPHDQYLAEVADAIHASLEKDDAHDVEPEAEKAFSRIMMQNALFHISGGQLDALAFSRFRALGLFTDVPPPPLPESLAKLLREATQSAGSHGERGRLVLVPEEKVATIVDVDSILLHPDAHLRMAALDYLRATDDSADPWLTPRTLEILKHISADIASEDDSRWRGAAITAAGTVRQDVLALLSSLRQSLIWNYREGINEYLNNVMQPSFEAIAQYRPPVWHPSEQREEITSWILDLAKLPVLGDALSGYLHRCGYVPLSHDLSASKLVTAWMAEHPDAEVTWASVWEWAVQQVNPAARYHALTVALHVPHVRPVGEWEQFWAEVIDILDVRENAESSGSSVARWQLSCELASHFARHLEALHPAQHGDSVACYAWWLAAKVGGLLGHSEKNAEWSLREIVLPQGRFSYFRWTVARSPIIPSPLRYATLHVQSLWAMSLLTNLGLAAKALPQPAGIPHALQQTIAHVFHGYLVTSHLAQVWNSGEVLFAMQENEALENLCTLEGYVPNDERGSLANLIEFRKHLSNPEEVESYLDQFFDLPPHVQQLLVLALKDIVYSTTKYDDMLAKWLERTKDVVELLKTGSEPVVNPLLEMCAEFQQHQVAGWSIRLPHLLTYVIEDLKDPDRIGLLATHVLQMSVNGGIGSAVQRLACSRRWSVWPGAVGSWRGNLQDIARYSEPWIASRVRSISTTISRLIGPHRRNTDQEDTQGVEDSAREDNGR